MTFKCWVVKILSIEYHLMCIAYISEEKTEVLFY